MLHTHSLDKSDTIIAGDFNICLMREERHHDTSDFINMMSEFFFRPLITMPTRQFNRSSTLIDHIWTNCTISPESYIFLCDITDHYPVFCRLNLPFQSSDDKVKVKFRNMCQTNKLKFSQLIRNTDWSQLFEGIIDAKEQLSRLMEVIEGYYNSSFPYMVKHIGIKRLRKPWMTNALLTSISNKL